MQIRIQRFRSMRFRVQGYDSHNYIIIGAKKSFYILEYLPLVSRGSLRPQKRTSIISKTFFTFSFFLWVIFSHLDPDPALQTKINADPDPQHILPYWTVEKDISELIPHPTPPSTLSLLVGLCIPHASRCIMLMSYPLRSRISYWEDVPIIKGCRGGGGGEGLVAASWGIVFTGGHRTVEKL